jgi:hypothetical protein
LETQCRGSVLVIGLGEDDGASQVKNEAKQDNDPNDKQGLECAPWLEFDSGHGTHGTSRIST